MSLAAPASTSVPAVAPTLHRPPAQVPLKERFFYGLGAVAYGIKDNGFSVFLLIYLNQMIGLDPGRVGITLLVVLVLDAMFDPVVGHWTDATRSRWGRRHPFLYASAIPIALFWVLLWIPPSGEGWAPYLWVFFCALAVRMSLSLNEVPSLAMLPEMTSDPHERTEVVGWRFMLGWLGGLITLGLAYGFFKLIPIDEASQASYHAYAMTGAAVMFVSVLAAAMGTHRRYARPVPATTAHPSIGDMIGCARYRPFRILVLAMVFAFASQGVTFAITNYVLGYVWQLTSAGLLAYAVLLGVGVALGLYLARALGRRVGKRRTAMTMVLITPFIGAAPFLLFLLGELPDALTIERAAVVFLFAALSTGTGVAGLLTAQSMMADVTTAYRVETGRAREGVFFAGQLFIQKCVGGLGIFIVGQMLVLVGFPAGAVKGAVAREVLSGLVVAYGTVTLMLGMLAAYFLSRFPLDERIIAPVQE